MCPIMDRDELDKQFESLVNNSKGVVKVTETFMTFFHQFPDDRKRLYIQTMKKIIEKVTIKLMSVSQ